jgi:SAM-dependent methyltransferase
MRRRESRAARARDDGQVTGYRLYQDLADWWPVISPVGDYAADAAALGRAFASAARPVREVLDLGCGGGHIGWHLKARFELTLADISADMLAVSRRLNPECEHVQGDMRTMRLGREFDAVLVHDAVDYITGEAELVQVARTAFAHCRPGGVAVFAPDHSADTFRPGAYGGGGADQSGRRASFTERTSDPDPADEWIVADYVFTLRTADNREQVVRESHRLSAFRYATWQRVLASAGFEPSDGNAAAAYALDANAAGPRHLFLGRRAAASLADPHSG